MADYLQDLVQNIYTNCDMKGFNDYNRAVQNLTKVSKQSARERIKLHELEEKSRIRINDYEEKYAMKKAKRDEAEITRMQKRNWLWRGAIRLIGAYFSIQTLRNIVQTGSKLQLIQRSIEGLTGSSQDWDFLNQQAYKFGLSLNTVASGYKNFYSSASMAGFGRGQIQSMFSDILLGARSIGASDQQIGGALLALEQMMSKGRVSMEELRRQLGNALPGAFEIGAKAMGVTTAKFNELVKAGISANEFVPKFIKTFKEQYEKGWADVEQTAAIGLGRIGYAWEKFAFEFLHGETGKALAQGLNRIAEFMVSPRFIAIAHALGQIFTLVVQILSYAIQHLQVIMYLMGSAGIYRWLRSHRLLWRMINQEIGGATMRVALFGKHGVLAFRNLKGAALGFLGVIFKVLLPLLVLEDVVVGLGQRFLGWNAKSLTGDFLVAQKDLSDTKKRKAWENLKIADDIRKKIDKDPLLRKALDRAEESGDYQKIAYILQHGYLPAEISAKKPTPAVISAPTGYAANITDLTSQGRIDNSQIIPTSSAGYVGTLPDLSIDKEHTSATNVNIGDIYIQTNGGDALSIAKEVQDQLVSLFIEQGLTFNAESVIV